LAPATTEPQGNDFDREAQQALQGADAKKALKTQLEGKVYSGRASTQEINLLKAICKDLHDRACIDACRQMLQKQQN
jgi:hypothetical protein